MFENSAVRDFVVLVVEDEPLLQIHAVDLLEREGFSVIAASNADDAIELLETRSDIRIVFTDIDMPGTMDGLRLAAVVRDRWPPVELILTSGHFVPQPEHIPERGRFFSKPYRDHEVVSAIREFAGRP